MKWRNKIAGILAVTIISTTVMGCNSITTSKSKEEEVAMGRYIEEAIEMPEAVVDGSEIAFQMFKNPEDKIEILSAVLEPQQGESFVQYTLKEDNTWERKVPKWLNTEGISPGAVCYAPDGTLYAISNDYKEDSIKVNIFKSQDEANLEEITLDAFKEPLGYEEVPRYMSILQDGSMLFSYAKGCSIYSKNKLVAAFEGGSESYAISDNKILMLNKKGDGVIIGDINTGKSLEEIPFQEIINSVQFSSDKEGNWFMVSETGIHRLVKDGTTWETILDGSLASMSMPSYLIETFLTGSKEDFYVMYQYGDGKRDIKHYTYKADVPTTPGETISVLSLEENPTVRQAIIEYQRQNLDVKVDYRVAMSDEDGTTVSDHMKVINTEILAGNGADIIILDGMPVDSYIEKGVLTDLSDIINPMLERGEIQENILKAYNKDDKIYTVPLRFEVPLAFGKKEAVQSVSSMETLAEYAKNKAEVPILGGESHSYAEIITKMYPLYASEIREENGELNREATIKFLENLKALSEQTQAVEELEDVEDDYNMLNSWMISMEEAELGFTDLNLSFGMYFPMEIMKQTGGSFGTIKNEFLPKGLVGINNASSNKKLAEEFIKVLYSETVQNNELGDGLPVNSKALENWGMEPNDFLVGIEDLEASQPSKEKMKEIINLCKTVDTPISEDQVLLDMMIEEIKPYLTGEIDVESAADKMIEKTKVYMTTK